MYYKKEKFIFSSHSYNVYIYPYFIKSSYSGDCNSVAVCSHLSLCNIDDSYYLISLTFLTDYSFERETGGLRRIAGYGVTVTRGAASAMMFTYCALLITMSRNMITFFRETFLHRFIPWDSMHALHKFIAYQALFSTGKYNAELWESYYGMCNIL